MIRCLLSDVCKVHSAVGNVARLYKSEQFWFVSRQGVELYCKAWGCGALPVFYLMGNGALYHGVKEPGRESDY